jgi:hypothetical protein
LTIIYLFSLVGKGASVYSQERSQGKNRDFSPLPQIQGNLGFDQTKLDEPEISWKNEASWIAIRNGGTAHRFDVIYIFFIP